MKILLRSGVEPNICFTTVLNVSGVVNLSQYSEPTKSILQKAFNDGNYVEVIEPIPQPIAVAVREIDARRLQLALLQLGKLSIVTSAIAGLGEAAKIDWEKATFIKEDYPLVTVLSTNLGLDVNAIFTLASSLS